MFRKCIGTKYSIMKLIRWELFIIPIISDGLKKHVPIIWSGWDLDMTGWKTASEQEKISLKRIKIKDYNVFVTGKASA